MHDMNRQGPPLNPKTPAFTSTTRRVATENPVAIRSVASLGGSPAGFATSASARRATSDMKQPVAHDQPIPLVDLKPTTRARTMQHTVHYCPPRNAPAPAAPSAQSNRHTYPPTAGRPVSPEAYQFRPFPTAIAESTARRAAGGTGAHQTPVGQGQAEARSPRSPLRTDGSCDTLASMFVHVDGAVYRPAAWNRSPTETSAPNATAATAHARQLASTGQSLMRPAYANAIPHASNGNRNIGLGLNFDPADATNAIVPSTDRGRHSTEHPDEDVYTTFASTADRFRTPPPQHRRVGTTPYGQSHVSPTRGHSGYGRNALQSARQAQEYGYARDAVAVRGMRKRTVTIGPLCHGTQCLVKSIAGNYGPLRGCTWSVPGGQKNVSPGTPVQFHIVFERPEDAAACVAAAEGQFGFRFVFDQDQWKWEIELAEDVSSDNLYISGLPLDITEETLYKFLEPYGLVKSCKINLDRGGNRTGTAFARMESRALAEIAIANLHGTIFVDPWTGEPFSGSPMEVKIADCPAQKMLREERAAAKRCGRANTQTSGLSPDSDDSPIARISPVSELCRLVGERHRLRELLRQIELEIEELTPALIGELAAPEGPPTGGNDATGAAIAQIMTPLLQPDAESQRHQQQQQQQQQQHQQQQQQTPPSSGSESSPESLRLVTPKGFTITGIARPSQGRAPLLPQQATADAAQPTSGSQAPSGGPNSQVSNHRAGAPLPMMPRIWFQGGHLPAVPVAGSAAQTNIWAPVPPAQGTGPVNNGFDAALGGSLWPNPGA